jgi:hypothetical protein
MSNETLFSKSCSNFNVDTNIQDRREVNILILPSEILQNILLLLDVKSIIRTCITNRDTTKYLLPPSGPVREYSDQSKYLYDDYFWFRFVSVNYDPAYYGVDSWSKENLKILLDVTVGNVWLYFLKLIIYGKDVPIYFLEQVVYMKIQYEDTIKDISETYFKTITLLNEKIFKGSALSIFTNNMRYGECFNIVFYPKSKDVYIHNINLYNGLVNRTEMEKHKADYKFNLCASHLGRKLFYDKLLIQAPQLHGDPYNQGIREPLIPKLLNFELYSQKSDNDGHIWYRYK